MYIENIVIGKPIVPLEMLLADENNPQDNWREITVFDDERFLPKLLVKYGFSSSIKELRRNRQDLIINLDKLDCLEIEFKKQKRKVYIVVGE